MVLNSLKLSFIKNNKNDYIEADFVTAPIFKADFLLFRISYKPD